MADLEHDKWIKKYKLKLVHAWRNGLDDQRAAEKLEIPFEEYQRHLAMDERLMELRDKYVDELRRIAREHIANKIKDGDRQTCEWYLEKTDPMFGAKDVLDGYEQDDSLSTKREDIRKSLEEFMKSNKGKTHKFDGDK